MASGLPADFGRATCAWPLDRDAVPAEVRAAFIQHRLVVEARVFMGEQASNRDFARVLGDESANGIAKTRRKLLGETPLSLSEMAQWSAVFRVDLSSVTGRTASDPEAYPPLYRALIVQDGQQIRFRRRNELHWDAAAPQARELIGSDVACNPALVTNDVVRLRLHQALTSSGFDPALIRVTPTGLTLLVNEPVDVQVQAAPSDDDNAWAHVRHALVAPASRTVILVLGHTASARLGVLAPGLLQTDVGEFFELPTAAFEETATIGEVPQRSWEVQAHEESEALTLLVLCTKSV